MLKRINLNGNPNLGVYISVNDEIAIVPFNFPVEMESILKETMEVDIIKTSIAGSNLNGVLSVGNSNGFLVSPFAYDREIELLESAGLNVARLPGKFTAVGNILAVNDYAAIAGPDIGEETVKIIEDTLKVPVKIYNFADTKIVGSASLISNKGALLHRDSLSDEVSFIEDFFKVEANIGTVCRGMPLVGACGIANSNGVMVGESTTGPEMARIEEALGFLDFGNF